MNSRRKPARQLLPAEVGGSVSVEARAGPPEPHPGPRPALWLVRVTVFNPRPPPGKYLNVVRECGRDVTCPVAKEVVYTLKERAYVEQIEKAFSYASTVLLDFLMEEQELVAHLRCVRPPQSARPPPPAQRVTRGRRARTQGCWRPACRFADRRAQAISRPASLLGACGPFLRSLAPARDRPGPVCAPTAARLQARAPRSCPGEPATVRVTLPVAAQPSARVAFCPPSLASVAPEPGQSRERPH